MTEEAGRTHLCDTCHSPLECDACWTLWHRPRRPTPGAYDGRGAAGAGWCELVEGCVSGSECFQQVHVTGFQRVDVVQQTCPGEYANSHCCGVLSAQILWRQQVASGFYEM